MKQLLISFLLLHLLHHQVRSQNTGIGTTTPNADALLHVDVGNSTSKGLLVTGELSVTSATVPSLGFGSRLMFFPAKAAFRAGFAQGTDWDNVNVGKYSAAIGYSPVASGEYSLAFGRSSVASEFYAVALGDNARATGFGAVAIGRFNGASGSYALALGEATHASGFNSTSLGYFTRASGRNSLSAGNSNIAKGFASTVIGTYNDTLLADDELNLPSAASPLLIVGNGNDHGQRSNALVVRKDGKVGIGNFVPEYTLDVGNRMRLRSGGDFNNTAGIWYNPTTNGTPFGFIGAMDNNTLGFYGGGGANWSFVMNTNNGNVGIGNAYPTQKLHVEGNICHTGTIGACSDIRYKTNILPVSNALSAVLALTPIYYNWNKEFKEKAFTADRQLGFSAQEIEKHFPEIVQTDAAGYKAVDYSRMTPVLVEAMKEQQQLIDKLEEEKKQQQADINEMKLRLEKLEKLVKKTGE
jgi:hypothetical protein